MPNPTQTHSRLPWQSTEQYNGETFAGHAIMNGNGYRIARLNAVDCGDTSANAAFIVTACNSHESLMAEVEKLREAMREMKAIHNGGGSSASACNRMAAIVEECLAGETEVQG